MVDIIAPDQSNFTLGRQISDNVVIAQEVIHIIRHKQGRKGCMTIKIDLEKIYDRINRKYLEETLQMAHF